MATASQASSGQGDRGVVVASLLVLLTGAAAGFGGVFAGRGPTLRLVGAAVASVLLAALLLRRHLLLSVLASAVALAIALGLMVFPTTTFGGVPTRATIAAIVRSLGRLGEHAAREVAPAAPLTSLMTASILAVWTAGAAAHALAARSRSAVLPLLPPAALLAFAGVVTERGPAPLATVIALVGALGVLFGVGLGRIALWGPVVPWGGRRRHLLGGTTVRWAGRLGLVAIAAALVLPGLLPGYRSSALLTFEPGPGGRVAISPIVDIRPSLLQNPTADLFYVRADRRAYWRMLSLDRFTGEVWTSSNLAGQDGVVLSGPTRLPDGGLPGEELEQEVRIAGLAVPWLPAAFQPVLVEHAAGPGSPVLRHDAEQGMLVRDRPTERGDRYTVVSRITVPTARQLDRSYGDVELVDPLSAQFAPYLALPAGLPAEIGEIARQLTEDEPTPFRKLLAIQSHLRSFTYDETAPPGHGTNHIVNFLTETQTGFCEQFAGTFAVLARSLGLPARVAVGFLPGPVDDFGQFKVTTAEAHAWPEVFFPRYGWMAFEPTPTRSNPVASQYLTPRAGLGGPRFSGPRESGAGLEDLSEGRRQREAFETPRKRGPLGSDPSGGGGGERDPWLLRVLALVAALSAGLIVLAIGKLAVRRMAAARAGSPREGVTAAYRAFLGSASDLGMGRRPGETPREFGIRLRADVRFSDGHVDRLTRMAGMALYSDAELTVEDVREAADAARVAAWDLHRHAGVARSAAGLLRPSRPLA